VASVAFSRKDILMARNYTPTSKAGLMDRGKRLAARIVASMEAQGYMDIEYILTGQQLKIVASKYDGAPQTTYLTLPQHRLH